MPVLENARHELFTQAIASGETQDRAYELAGYKPDRPHASRLATNGNIANRVAEMQTAAAEKTGITIASVTENLLRIASKAEALGDSAGLSVARIAHVDVAKLAGLVTKKQEHSTSTEMLKALMEISAKWEPN